MIATGNSGEAGFWGRVDKSQLLKWTVYSLLLLNMVYYAGEEAYIASHTLPADAPWWDWAEAFATTIDELAWFGLLFMFELETYILEDEDYIMDRNPGAGGGEDLHKERR